MDSLARGYDDWRTSEPPEGPRRCNCGHDLDNHGDEPESPDRDAMKAALQNVLEIAHRHLKSGAQPSAFASIIAAAEQGLYVCSIEDCECLKFEPADPTDDRDAAFDSHGER